MAVTMSDKVPPLNFLGSQREKVFLECGGHVYSVPVDDVKNLPLLDSYSKSYYALGDNFAHFDPQRSKSEEGHETMLNIKRVASETNCSDVSSTSDAVTSAAESPPLVRCCASRGLAEAKEEATRLIDELILKIELNWFREKLKDDAIQDTENPTVDEVVVEQKVSAVVTTNPVHPDGDYNNRDYRVQNLEILKSKSFRESKSQTRMGLLEKMRTLVERLKDLEKLE
ncbi:uncharacterized protein LOC131215844 [Anopheles bellator]|uniref:uncharacterized protein LOC131215844 n=1 Tax=Anopheles bellator TaxID=139047 RepID=UPI00264797F0|nr:uncharacterized protein LOC131215844 [Anopheles bellator]